MSATRRTLAPSMLFCLCVAACSPAPTPTADVELASNEAVEVAPESDTREPVPPRDTPRIPDDDFNTGEPAAPNTGELSDPREFLRAHNLALKTDDEGWRDAVDVLSRAGDAFTLEHLARIDRTDLSEADAGQLDSAVHAINARVQQSGTTLDASLVLARLERAAYADLMCDALEAELQEWTFESIGAQLEDPAVVAELERLDASYTPTVELETLFSSMDKRVPVYVTRLLSTARAAGG